MREVYFVEPNNLGADFITRIYKELTAPLKTMPLIFIIPLSIIIGFFAYLILNQLIVKLATLLQYGF